MKNKKFEFGKRRIVGVNYTRYLALPKFWLKNWGLEKGDSIQLVLGNKGELILKPAETSIEKRG